MANQRLKVARIGNSRGVRIPAQTLHRYDIGDELVMEERSDGILLRRPGHAIEKLSWAETAIEMSAAKEDWSDWEITATDGLEDLEWNADRPLRVAESHTGYMARRRKRK
jgi:antitoxin component of MazEF toxin-antitoxin module